MDLLESIDRRRSVRAFLPKPVPTQLLRSIFERAQRAPSWCNIQPWRAYVASGDVRDQLATGLLDAAKNGSPKPDVPFPLDYPEPYATYRRQCGLALYSAMGVARGDTDAKQKAWHRNFVAFDAPHIAICGIDARFDLYAALDVGCWLQTVLLLATSEGLATCAQASLSLYPDVARRILDIPEGIKILFGIGLGYEDEAAAANQCRTSREPASENIRFMGASSE